MSDAQPSEDFHQRARARARHGEHGWPGALAWLAGLAIHLTLVVLLVI